ncbi:hypothetical protein SAMD00024442_1_45 [Candidatus Symbiothrix dinenymphae]|nr:hypothetical protein SAMD00024442_1_45 [Candidatus Symbiothrix dinenymphae]
MTNDFSDIQQTAENKWLAHYHGNYGIYTVKIEFDSDGQRRNFSCSCPSDHHLCKHIGYLEAAIQTQAAQFDAKHAQNELTVEAILQYVSLDELRTFVVKKAKYNSDLAKAITFEFAEKLKKPAKTIDASADDEATDAEATDENFYKPLVEADLNEVEFDAERFYDYDYDSDRDVDLSILRDWLNKAEKFVEQQEYDDALLVCKAVIEAYADWYEEADGEICDNIFLDYQQDFFDLLGKMAENEQIDKPSLYEYCKQQLSEHEDSFYDRNNMLNDLMGLVAHAANPDEFVKLQNDLLENVSNKTSSEAGKIVKRLYKFYLSNNQKDKADKLVEENWQIEYFFKLAVEKRIAEKRYDEAKQLILRFKRLPDTSYESKWNGYLLTIAQAEKDVPAIRTIAFEFIKNTFDKQYYRIYKATFSDEKWQDAFENLYNHYDKPPKDGWHSDNCNIPNLLLAEKLVARLVDYIETHLSATMMEEYYAHFLEEYPEKTLELFRKAVDMAATDSGERSYHYVCRLLKLIKGLPNGAIVVSQIIDNYRVMYKRRHLMMELLGKIV